MYSQCIVTAVRRHELRGRGGVPERLAGRHGAGAGGGQHHRP